MAPSKTNNNGSTERLAELRLRLCGPNHQGQAHVQEKNTEPLPRTDKTLTGRLETQKLRD